MAEKRFAIDHDLGLQYTIEFNEGGDGVEVTIHGSKEPIRSILENGVNVTAYDDDLCEGTDKDGKPSIDRPVYYFTVKFENGKASVSDFSIGAAGKLELPAHLPPYAQVARAHNNEGRPPSIDDYFADKVKENPLSGYPTRPAYPPVPKTNRRMSVSDTEIINALAKYGMDLTERAREGRLDPVVGREKELRDIRQLLLRKKRSNVMLLGEAGVGKTAIAEGIAQNIADGKAEAELANARVIALNLQDMNAGTMFRGSFEERLMPILKGLEERDGYLKGQKIILFIDEIHSALTAGQAMGGTNAGQMMKPYLSSGSLACIGATTPEEYKKHIEKDKAMVRRFQPYTLEEPNREDTLTIMQGVQKSYSEKHGMAETLSDKMVEYAVRMTERFMPTQQQPDKSIGIIDDAMAIARSNGRSKIVEEDVILAVSKASGLKEEFLNQSDFERYAKLEENLKQRVIGQDDSIAEIASDLRASRAGLTKDTGPRGVYLIPGPTGVGKTEFSKALAELLTGDEKNIVRIDMGKYQERHTVSSLIGAPPGFVGHDDANAGELTEPVRQKPFSIVLLDEVEKAHPDVFKTLLSVFDDGELKDSKGRNVNFTNTIFVMTTNLGAKEIQAQLSGEHVGFNTSDIKGAKQGATNSVDKEKISAIAQRAIEQHFPPELVNRIDGVYPFFQLEKEHIVKILDLRLKDVAKSLRDSAHGLQLENAELEVSQAVKDALAEKGYDRKFGARPLNRTIKRELTSKLALWMMENKADLLRQNEKGAFKIVIKSLSDSFKPKIVPVARNDNKQTVQAPKIA